jgi:hypothetical protein
MLVVTSKIVFKWLSLTLKFGKTFDWYFSFSISKKNAKKTIDFLSHSFYIRNDVQYVRANNSLPVISKQQNRVRVYFCFCDERNFLPYRRVRPTKLPQRVLFVQKNALQLYCQWDKLNIFRNVLLLSWFCLSNMLDFVSGERIDVSANKHLAHDCFKWIGKKGDKFFIWILWIWRRCRVDDCESFGHKCTHVWSNFDDSGWISLF